MKMNAVMVMIDDQNQDEIADLAIYGLQDPNCMSKGRSLVSVEPHYKIRQDGALGIRVDNVDDIIFDATFNKAGKNGSWKIGSSSKDEEFSSRIVVHCHSGKYTW
jgi:hypothetical protein